jgi:hypothetical protein
MIGGDFFLNRGSPRSKEKSPLTHFLKCAVVVFSIINAPVFISAIVRKSNAPFATNEEVCTALCVYTYCSVLYMFRIARIKQSLGYKWELDQDVSTMKNDDAMNEFPASVVQL